MAHFLLHAVDKPDALSIRMAARPEHLAWVQSHAKHIVMAGPMFGDDGETFAGSCFVLDFPDVKAARAWAAQDPYVHAGLFERVEIRPFKWLFGAVMPE